ncbi:hypothetical protein [Streptomyces sp. NPDC050856]|uniref:hypothetical protein n=1 Tax=Streptomyces sp. NPDC050856 TaxID=3154939 RepID=UPI003406AD47
MRGDETQPTAERTGPRHAAPRKSLLHKLQAPAGKAVALAAMPTAVLVGLGLTPRLALADEKDIPYAPGPCVTRSDEPEESAEPSPSGSGTPSPKPAPGASEDEKEPSPGASPSASPSVSPSASVPAQRSTGPGTGVTALPATVPATRPGTAAPSASATPTPTRSRNPLDPLGVGDALTDILDGREDDTPTATPSTTPPTAVPSAEPPATGSAKPSATASAKPSAGPSNGPSTRPSAGPTSGDDALDKVKEAIKEAAGKAGAEVEELPEDVKGLDPKQDEDIPDGAKPRFPCPTPDPQALADAEAEPGIPLLPDDPWKLESSRLTLNGLDYHGIVEVRTGSGKTKKVLKFTASSVGIKDLHQLTVHSKGYTGHVTSRPGSTSTITGGTVTMYTEELKGNLFGIIPITFSPETPPPLNVSYAFFTDVKVTQAGQFGGTLTVPGLRNFIEG